MGLHKDVGGSRTRTVDPDWLKWYPIPCHVMVSNTTRDKGERRMGNSEWCLSSLKMIACNETCFPGSGWTSVCQWKGSKWIPYFACTHSSYFTSNKMTETPSNSSQSMINSMIQTVLISTHVFTHFCLSDSLPHSISEELVSSCVVHRCLLGLKHMLMDDFM